MTNHLTHILQDVSYISSIGIAVPRNKFDQSVISRFMEHLSHSDEQKRKIKATFRASAIQSRYSVLEDYGRQEAFTFFPNTNGMTPFPGTSARMEEFRAHALNLSIEAIENCREAGRFNNDEVTHLITVSCTGMYAPGLDIDIVNQLGLASSVNRTCINFMGCFAAINAIKTADAFCKADPKAKVLVVCTELCSLHFQKEFTDDNILANALFADGSAALLVQREAATLHSIYIEGFYNDIVGKGAQHMAWTIGNLGFEMKLSSYVPDILGDAIEGLVSKLKQTVQVNGSTPIHYVIHPGGKKILDEVAARLKIAKTDLQHSYDVLRNYGNMSSPTILFVLKKLMDSNELKKDDRIMGMAFGPGVTLESMMLKVS